jgi:hypothetical protein
VKSLTAILAISAISIDKRWASPVQNSNNVKIMIGEENLTKRRCDECHAKKMLKRKHSKIYWSFVWGESPS